MCGICGELRFGSTRADSESVARMVNQMEARGPDASGVYCQGAVALGQARLKIIDLSEASAQPMVDNHLGLSIVYNGAIYNYPELKKELESLGHQFFSSGDTEVILKSYKEWGPSCVERLNGMFAFAICERDSGRLFLARDRLGIKPLYTTETDGVFRFASSLPALLKGAPGVDTSIDPVALHNYMTFHSVVPAPHTMLKGVRKLPPASWMLIENDGSRKTETYWSMQFATEGDLQNRSEEDWKEALHLELRKAVRRRLVADVEVGVLLSGGLDSSLIVGLLSEEGQQNLHSFSIGFETVGDEVGDEFKYSDVIAREFATQHHKIQIDSTRALPALEGTVAAMSEPMVSHDCVGFYLLSEEVSKHLKVVQSGQGADEIFGGYHWYPPMQKSTNPFDTYRRVFFDRSHQEYLEAVNPRFHDSDFSAEFVCSHFQMPGATDPADKALRIDSSIMLVDDPVKRVDNMTMAWGLEARVPFLDHELVEFAATIPANLKIREGGKHILKEMARDVIPHDVIDRPKGYFPVPALKYLRGPYLEMVNDLLDSKKARERDLFNADYVSNLRSAPEDHITPLRGSKLWQVALLELWLQTNEV